MANALEAAIIGAGPYGLSIAAHLRARGLRFRIFGRPMESWRLRMPAGMFLKSEGFNSDLYDAEGRFTFKQFCAENGLSYGEDGVPIPLEAMTAYGLSFQERFVPDLENRMVVAVEPSPGGFLLQLDDGETLTVPRVIVAVGLSYFPYVPPCLAHLPSEFLSHSSEHHDLSRFKGRDVTVVGGGASALDLAALLHEAGAQVRLVVRQWSVKFNSKPGRRSFWDDVRHPRNGLGGGWKSLFFANMPMLFRYLPREKRLRIIRTYLGPSGAWGTKDCIGRLPLLLGREPKQAQLDDGQLRLHVNGDGAPQELLTEHVIAATGYRVDVRRLVFLDEKIRSSLRLIENAPVLSQDFESSMPRLYFVGLASTHCFGPSMRFICGAGYTARRLSEHLTRVAAS